MITEVGKAVFQIGVIETKTRWEIRKVLVFSGQRPMAQIATYIDDERLDYDWGGYTFRVIGRELVAGGPESTTVQLSESNWIQLIQPPEVWVPDAFTVNGDGIQSKFGVPLPIIHVKNYSMKVYDRWGKKIMGILCQKSNNGMGLYNGKQVPDGVYAWLLTFDGWDEENRIRKRVLFWLFTSYSLSP